MTQTTLHSCLECGRPIEFTASGWIHVGGSLYWLKCSECGWQGSVEGFTCPNCVTDSLVDDHAALPDRTLR